jgi:hypothetical protein
MDAAANTLISTGSAEDAEEAEDLDEEDAEEACFCCRRTPGTAPCTVPEAARTVFS